MSAVTTLLRRAALATGLLTTGLFAASCQSADEPDDASPHAIGQRSDAIKAPLSKSYCSVNVTSKGVKQTEEDYLPHVIACENPNGDPESLKAQAVAARSVLYWTIASYGSICDSQSCQVYSCSHQPEAKHYAAVKATSGQYLAYNNEVTYGFYVNGSEKVDASCKNSGSSVLNKYVTYNAGKTGTSVKQTTLGYVGKAGNGQNRGCMSQFGANCLADKGKSYTDILKFYYGDDVQLLTSSGSCVSAPATAACGKDADCSNNTPGEGVVCKQGACVDGCRSNADCPSGGTCASGSCSNAPAKLGSTCDSDDDCGAGSGRVCGASSKKCIVGCHGDGNCGEGATCDKSNPRSYRCVKRKEIGQACSGDSDCNGGVSGTTRVCVDGTCADSCRRSFDCHDDETCETSTHSCQPKEQESNAPDSSCVLTYPSVTLQGIATPDDVKKQYAQRGCESQAPACVLDVNNLVDAKTRKKLSYNHVKLAPNFTLRELTYQSAQVSPYVYVAPALVEALQRTRTAHGVIPVTSGYRSAAKQAQVCKGMCGKSTCKNSKGSTTCAQCSNHMDGKAADLKHSSPKCKLAGNSCDPGKFHLIFNEGAGGDHLHVDLGSSPVCTYQSISGCAAASTDDPVPPSSSSGPPGSDPESPGASNGPCLSQLKALGVSFTPITQRNVIDAVRLTGPLNGVTIADGTGSSTTSQGFACVLVRHLYDFMGSLREAGIKTVGSLGSYCLRCCCSWSPSNDCRGPGDAFPQCGSKGLSDHSYGRALDIRYLTTTGGQRYDIDDNGDWTRHGTLGHGDTCNSGLKAQSGTSKLLYQLACDNAHLFAHFLTPNYNSAHRNHWHIDVGKPGANTNQGMIGILPPVSLVPAVDEGSSEDTCGDGPDDGEE